MKVQQDITLIIKMGNLLIRITGMGIMDELSNVGITGECFTDSMKNDNSIIYWSTMIKQSDPVDIINQQIRDAAIQAVTDLGYIVDPVDSKTLLGGALRI